MRNLLLAPIALASLAAIASAQDDPAPEPVYKLGDLVPTAELSIEEFGVPTIGESFRMQLREAPALASSFLALRLADPDVMVEPLQSSDSIVLQSSTNAEGLDSIALPVPLDLRPGLLFDFQWAVIDPDSGNLLRSEVLRTRIVDGDRSLYSKYDSCVTIDFENLAGGFGTAALRGEFQVTYHPGSNDDEMLAEITSVSLTSPSVIMDNGQETGDLGLHLKEAVQVPIHYSDGLQVNQECALRLFAGVLAPDFPASSEFTESYIDVYGVFLAGRSGDSGSVEFGGFGTFSGADDAQESSDLTILEVTGDLLDQEEFCVLGDTFKVSLELTITVIKDVNGVPTWTPDQVQAAIDKANDIWCTQCCIRIDQKGDIQYKQAGGLVDINIAERQGVHNAHKNNGTFDVILTGTLTGATTGATTGYRSPDPTIFAGGNDGNPNTLAHEVGHLLNISDWRNADNIMNGKPNANKRELTKSQCDFARGTDRVKEDFSPCAPMPEG